jgi:hypothetical protein
MELKQIKNPADFFAVVDIHVNRISHHHGQLTCRDLREKLKLEAGYHHTGMITEAKVIAKRVSEEKPVSEKEVENLTNWLKNLKEELPEYEPFEGNKDSFQIVTKSVDELIKTLKN